jgi:hypothetical protein
MSGGKHKAAVILSFAFPSLITSAASAGYAGRRDALGSAACDPDLRDSAALWFKNSVSLCLCGLSFGSVVSVQ